MGEWVLIFIQLQAGMFSGSITLQPIYFQNEAACAAVARELNGGPEPTKEFHNMSKSTFSALAIGVICRSTKL